MAGLACAVFIAQIVGALARTGGADFDIQTGHICITILDAGFTGWAF
jgi:hypothetical protein